jgi:hypothetical protein
MNRAKDTQMDTWPTNAFSVFPVWCRRQDSNLHGLAARGF